MTISNYNTGFPQGVTIRNAPILDLQNSNGNIFWVDSTRGSNENKGTFTFPLETLQKALTLVKADQGDKIFLAAGHTESISDATSYNVNTDGIQIIGLGTAFSRPIITFTTLATAILTVSARDVYIGNIVFETAIAGMSDMVLLNGSFCTLENCTFVTSSVGVDNFVDVAESGTKFINCQFISLETTTVSAIKISESSLEHQIIDCIIQGKFSEGCIYVPSGLSGSGVFLLFVDGGYYVNSDSTGYMLSANSHTQGHISDSVSINVTNLEKLPIYSTTASKIGKGKAGDIISFTTIIPVGKVDGTGGNFVLEIASGSFYLEDAIIETDNNALGGATNIHIQEEDDTYGKSIFYSETVANLSGSESISLEDASLVGLKRGFAEASRIRVSRSGSALTGTNLRVSFVLRLLEDGSVIVKNPSF